MGVKHAIRVRAFNYVRLGAPTNLMSHGKRNVFGKNAQDVPTAAVKNHTFRNTPVVFKGQGAASDSSIRYNVYKVRPPR
eukprot:UN26263